MRRAIDISGPHKSPGTSRIYIDSGFSRVAMQRAFCGSMLSVQGCRRYPGRERLSVRAVELFAGRRLGERDRTMRNSLCHFDKFLEKFLKYYSHSHHGCVYYDSWLVSSMHEHIQEHIQPLTRTLRINVQADAEIVDGRRERWVLRGIFLRAVPRLCVISSPFGS
jgi:hypothetical protein